MEKIIKLAKEHFPIPTIFIIVVILFATNYVPDTYLTGWDNLHLEFFISENIKRNIFSVWQEYQGLGLLAGMGHAADLPRQIFLLIPAIFLPQNLIRYFEVFFALFLGATGIYVLINYLFKKVFKENKLIALVGAIFYLFHIATIQIFYIPFEAFIIHYAAFPWIILITLIYINKPTIKNALLLFIVFFLTSSQAYIPTLFISTMLAISIMTLPFFYKNFKKTLIAYIKLVLIIIAANAYWLFPFAFFTLTNSAVNVGSKINQMATEIIFLQNREYGNLQNVPLLKGFLFANVEPNLEGEFGYLMKTWKSYTENPITLLANYLLFGVIIVGAIKLIRGHKMIGLSFALLFIFGFTMLATSTPPFSWINSLIREIIPLFNQAFRFPYTKFLTVAEASYAVLFAVGVYAISQKAKRYHKNMPHLVITLFVLLLILIAVPAFKGEFLYEKETIKIPNEYFQTFEYFKDQDPNTRIANFPQYTFWGWGFYKWGYSGSGFLWYGIKQPIIDRAFDVWSAESENYYWEMSHALYSKNPEALDNVLNKYDINFLLVDENVVNPVSPKSLFITELENLIENNPNIKKDTEFGNIDIYKVELKNPPNSFVGSFEELRNVNDYKWSDDDQAYRNLGDYYSDPDSDYTNYYPFRSIFSDKNYDNSDIKIAENSKYIVLESPLPKSKKSLYLKIPSPTAENNTLPVNILAENNGQNIIIKLQLNQPEVFILNGNEQKQIWKNSLEKDLFILPQNSNYPVTINVNGISEFRIEKPIENSTYVIGSTSLTTQQNNVVVLRDNIESVLSTARITKGNLDNWFPDNKSTVALNEISDNASIMLRISKADDQYSSIKINPAYEVEQKLSFVNNCDNFRDSFFSFFTSEEEKERLLHLSAEDAASCISFYAPTLNHDQGYLININNRNKKNQGLHFWVLNEDTRSAVTDLYLDNNQDEDVARVFIPPQERYGKAYSFHIENLSVGNVEVENVLGDITINPIPYHFITNLNIEDPNSPPKAFEKLSFGVKHPNQSLYLAKTEKIPDGANISLSQSYNPYWRAYLVSNFNIFTRALPFVFGEKIDNHIKVNNWKNGWIIEKDTTDDRNSVLIVFLPQYLQYIGFALTSGVFFSLIFMHFRHKKRQRNH